MKTYKPGQKVICIGHPSSDYEFHYGSFDFENHYSFLRVYKIVENIKASEIHKNFDRQIGIGPICVTENLADTHKTPDDYFRDVWYFSEKEMPLFFRVIEDENI